MTFTLTAPQPDVHHSGDPLGRSYTPDACALAIVTRLATLVAPSRPMHFLEPCLGGGAFVRAAQQAHPGIHCDGWDVDPDAPGRAYVEVFTQLDARVAAELRQGLYGLSASNPPFGKAVPNEVTVGIVAAARRCAAVSAMILPVDTITYKSMEHEVAAAAEVWPLLPRPWKHAQGMVVLVHVQGREDSDTLFRPLRWKART